MGRTVKIFDTTLRDGEQSPGCSMNLNEKIEVAKQLEALKVELKRALRLLLPVMLLLSQQSLIPCAALPSARWHAAVSRTSRRHGTPSAVQSLPAFTPSWQPARYTWSTS